LTQPLRTSFFSCACARNGSQSAVVEDAAGSACAWVVVDRTSSGWGEKKKRLFGTIRFLWFRCVFSSCYYYPVTAKSLCIISSPAQCVHRATKKYDVWRVSWEIRDGIVSYGFKFHIAGTLRFISRPDYLTTRQRPRGNMPFLIPSISRFQLQLTAFSKMFWLFSIGFYCIIRGTTRRLVIFWLMVLLWDTKKMRTDCSSTI